jgi:hypothetical protein
MAGVKDFKTVKECLEAGYSWEKCVGFQVDDNGNMRQIIKKTCPIPMRNTIRDKVFAGESITISTEKDDPKNEPQ